MMVEIYVCGPSAVHKIIVSTSKGKNEGKKKVIFMKKGPEYKLEYKNLTLTLNNIQ